MKNRLLILSIVGLCFVASPAWAGPYTIDVSGLNGEDSLRTIFDKMTIGDSSVDVTTDALADDWDSFWQVDASSDASASFIVEIAGLAGQNSVGIYDPTNSGNKLTLFTGTATTGWKATISKDAIVANKFWVELKDTNHVTQSTQSATFGSSLFGFYLNNGTTTFYSDSSQNSGDDQMLAFQGWDDNPDQVDVFYKLHGGEANSSFAAPWKANEYVLAWEDLPVTPDRANEPDYNDLVMMVESVSPVPVPAAVLLGFLGLGAAGLKLRRFA